MTIIVWSVSSHERYIVGEFDSWQTALMFVDSNAMTVKAVIDWQGIHICNIYSPFVKAVI